MKKGKKRSEEKKKTFGTLMAFIMVFSVLAVVIPAVANAPGGDGMQIPSAMNLTADPEWIYINGDQSLITATVYDNENYTEPIPYAVVNFTTSRGIITNVGEGGSISEKNCWAMTNESGVAIVALAPVIGSESGIATVKAVTGKGDVWKEVTVEFVKAEWRVVLFPDNESKETEVNENATYYIEVRNAGTADDTYDLSITSNDADEAVLNKTSVSLVANTSEIVELNVKDSTIGSYITTVRAVSTYNASVFWEITLRTIIPQEIIWQGEVTLVNMTMFNVTAHNSGVVYEVNRTTALGALDAAAEEGGFNYTVNDEWYVGWGLFVDSIADILNEGTSGWMYGVNGGAPAMSADSYKVEGGDVTTWYWSSSMGMTPANSSKVVIINVSVEEPVLEPDLVVTEITLNCGYIFANESNEMCGVIKNNGTADADAFNVSISTGSFLEEVRVSGLVAGEDLEICVTDPTLRNAGESVTITVIADCNGEIDETNETNNEKVQEETVMNNGYKNKSFMGRDSLELFQHDEEMYGGVVYNVSGTKNYPFEPAETDTRIHHIDIPADMTVKKARLYVYWYDYWGNPSPGYLANLSVNFSGITFKTPGKMYTDQKGFGTYNTPKGTYAYDVTTLVTASGDYNVVVENIDPTHRTTLLGEMLLVVYEDPTETKKIQLWIMEGNDLLKGDPNFCVTPEEATATVAFSGTIVDMANKRATLISVVAQGNEPGANMLFNGAVIKPDAWGSSTEAYPNSKINVESVDVTANLSTSGNNMGFQDTGTMGMEASNAILVVEYNQPDLIVTGITPNQLLANESNEICATVKNNGTADADAFNISFNVDVFSEEVRVNGGLAVGAETTACVTDPTWRTEGESVTITVTADCDAEIDESNEMNNESSLVVGVVLRKEYNVTIPLLEGWNMFGVPLNVSNWTLPVVLDTTEGKYNIVIYYNAASGLTEFFDPLIPEYSTLKELEPGAGYWIDMKEDDTAQFEGMKFTEFSRDLESEWNMFSVPYGIVNQTLPTALSSIEGKYNIVIYYNAASGLTEFFDPLIPEYSTLKELEPGAGYWIDMKVAATFTPEMNP